MKSHTHVYHKDPKPLLPEGEEALGRSIGMGGWHYHVHTCPCGESFKTSCWNPECFESLVEAD